MAGFISENFKYSKNENEKEILKEAQRLLNIITAEAEEWEDSESSSLQLKFKLIDDELGILLENNGISFTRSVVLNMKESLLAGSAIGADNDITEKQIGFLVSKIKEIDNLNLFD